MHKIFMPNQFSIKQKRAICAEARVPYPIGGLGVVARAHGLPRSTLQSWLKQDATVWSHLDANALIRVENKSTTHRGRPSSLEYLRPQMEAMVDQWRSERLRVSTRMVATWMITVDPTLAEMNTLRLHETVRRLYNSSGFSLRKPTHQAQRHEEDQDLISAFKADVLRMQIMFGIPDDGVANMDETPVPYDLPVRNTLSRVGARTVSVRGSRVSQRLSAALCCVKDGTKLPPLIILQGTANGRIARSRHTFPQGAVYSVQENAWMDEASMLRWVEEVWRPFALAKQTPTLLILDEFIAHKTAQVRAAIAECGTHVLYIPPSYTWILQPLDVGVNKPFKDYMRQQYDESVVAGNRDPASRLIVVNRVLDAWAHVSQEIITNSWRRAIEEVVIIQPPV